MKLKTLALAAGICLPTGFVVGYLFPSGCNKRYQSKENRTHQREERTESGIKNVTDETFEMEVLRSPQTVIVDFYANWCGTCLEIRPEVEEFSRKYTKIKFVEYDCDSGQNDEHYNVRILSTFIVFRDGQEVERYPHDIYLKMSDLEEMIKRYEK